MDLSLASPRADDRARTLVDPFGRMITYLRLSVTDRCDLRCTYCMAADQKFLPKADLLTLEELAALARAFMDRGVETVRLTGGEPLVRKGILDLVQDLGREVAAGRLRELTLTTNATRLAGCAENLARAGVRRINVSLDTRDPETYARLTRGGDVACALDGIAAAKATGIAVKINTVALSRDNADEIPDLIAWAHGEGFALSLIEVMPLGEIGADRRAQFLSLAEVREELERQWSLRSSDHATNGPSRYVSVEETGGMLGFITPLSENFCAGCNRVRVTCTGRMFMCLGRMGSADLRAALREGGRDALDAALDEGIGRKAERHDFDVAAPAPEVTRPMSMTGG